MSTCDKPRGVGYCADPGCAQFLRLQLLLPAPQSYACAACGAPGALELERGMRSGPGALVSEVRVEYSFDPARAIYRQRVAVREPRLQRRGVFTLQTPLIERPEAARALALALLRRFAPERVLERAQAAALEPPAGR